jgi:hypothetical protein
MKTIMQRRRNKFDHLRKLAGGNKGAVGFGHHKYAIEGQAADVGKACVRPIPRMDLTG